MTGKSKHPALPTKRQYLEALHTLDKYLLDYNYDVTIQIDSDRTKYTTTVMKLSGPHNESYERLVGFATNLLPNDWLESIPSSLSPECQAEGGRYALFEGVALSVIVARPRTNRRT